MKKPCPVCGAKPTCFGLKVLEYRVVHHDFCTPALRALVRAAVRWGEDRGWRGLPYWPAERSLERAVARFQKSKEARRG